MVAPTNLPLGSTYALVMRQSEGTIEIVLERLGRKRQRALLVFCISETNAITFSTSGSMELPWAVSEIEPVPQREIAFYFRWPHHLHNLLVTENPEDARQLLEVMQGSVDGVCLKDKAAGWICEQVYKARQH